MSDKPPTQDEILEPLPEGPRINISLPGVLVGLMAGLILGLTYAWQVDPVVLRNTSPADLSQSDKETYVIAIAQEYAAEQNLERAITRLLEVSPEGNPFEVAAETACQLIRAGRVTDVSSIGVIRNLRSIYEPQGVSAGCDTAAFNTPVPVTIVVSTPTASFTPSITPVATKTPTKAIDPAPNNTAIPPSTSAAQSDGDFREAFVEAFCNPQISGIIEIYVRDTDSLGVPGTPVEVTWGNRESQVFYTGLKPERGDDYADFVMEAGESYRVSVLDESQPTREVDAVPCDDAGTITSYRVVIQRFFNP
jgi:hypothetical protein